MSMNLASRFTGSHLTPHATQVKSTNAHRSGNVVQTLEDKIAFDRRIQVTSVAGGGG